MIWEDLNGRNSEFGGGLFREVVIYEIKSIFWPECEIWPYFCVWPLVGARWPIGEVSLY